MGALSTRGAGLIASWSWRCLKPSPCPISLSIPQQPTPMQLKCLALPDCRLLLILEIAWWRCEITEVLNRTEVWVLFCLLFEFRSSSQIEFFGIRWWKCVMCRIFKRSWHLERRRRGSWAGKQGETARWLVSTTLQADYTYLLTGCRAHGKDLGTKLWKAGSGNLHGADRDSAHLIPAKQEMHPFLKKSWRAHVRLHIHLSSSKNFRLPCKKYLAFCASCLLSCCSPVLWKS